jgi:hypothetical protein
MFLPRCVHERRIAEVNPCVKSRILAFLLLVFLVTAVLWLIFKLSGTEGGGVFGILVACLFLILILTALQSGDFAKHFLE